MAKRKMMRRGTDKRVFKKTANKTNSVNLNKNMMRGGFHF